MKYLNSIQNKSNPVIPFKDNEYENHTNGFNKTPIISLIKEYQKILKNKIELLNHCKKAIIRGLN